MKWAAFIVEGRLFLVWATGASSTQLRSPNSDARVPNESCRSWNALSNATAAHCFSLSLNPSGSFKLNVKIPANTTADVYLSAKSSARLYAMLTVA
jgi:hypothetical protein